MSIDITPDVENAVRRRAAAEGVSVNELLARMFTPIGVSQRFPDDPKRHVRTLIAELQADDNTPLRAQVPAELGETPSEALFRRWEQEDSVMTIEEIEAEKKLWSEFQAGINGTREASGMRRMF